MAKRINQHAKQTGDAHILVLFRGAVVVRCWSQAGADRAEAFLAKVPDGVEPDWQELRRIVFG